MLKFWELPPSPNSTKIRMALRFKGIDFTTVPADPQDRTRVIEVSGQELLPVIEDRGIVLNDSEAILNYLDANYRETPRLIPSSRADRRLCDEWKSALDRKLVPHWVPVFLHGIGRTPALDSVHRDRFEEELRSLDEQLSAADTFKGPDNPICDLRAAQWATFALPGAGLIKRVPLFKRFEELFAVPRGSLPRLERFLRPWNDRLA